MSTVSPSLLTPLHAVTPTPTPARVPPLQSGDRLSRDEFERRDEEGIIKSTIFPGLWLDVKAMLGGDRARVLQVFQRGVGSAEHQAFVDRLGKQRS